MNSTLKTLLIVLLIPLVIFGVTLILINVPKKDETEKGNGPAGGSSSSLAFTSSSIAHDPASDKLIDRYFPGYFEVSDEVHPVSFWFQNRHDAPVDVSIVGRGCAACTNGRIGVVPDDAMQDFLMRTAIDAVPSSALGPPNLLAGLSAALMLEQVKWHNFDFDRPKESGTTVPAAPRPGVNTWGIFQLGIKIHGTGLRPRLNATLAMRAGSSPEEQMEFQITAYGVPPFAVSPESIDLGNLAEAAPPWTTMVYYWSATRDPSDLPPPKLAYDPADPFLTVGQPELVSQAEVNELTTTLLKDAKGIPIRAVYRIPITVYRRRTDPPSNSGGPMEPDIGPFKRTIGISCPGTTHSLLLQVRANITGLVNLADGGTIDLGSFDGRFGVEKIVQLISEREGIELTVADKEHTPSAVQVTLSEPNQSGGRRRWTLRVAIPGGTILGDLPRESYVVLKAKTETGEQRVRIPIVGRGTRR